MPGGNKFATPPVFSTQYSGVEHIRVGRLALPSMCTLFILQHCLPVPIKWRSLYHTYHSAFCPYGLSGNMHYLTFWNWFISVGMMSLAFIWVVTCFSVSFLCHAHSIVWTCLFGSLPVHPAVDTWVATTFWPLRLVLLWAQLCTYLFNLCTCFFCIYTQEWNYCIS